MAGVVVVQSRDGDKAGEHLSLTLMEGTASVPVSPTPMVAFASTRERHGEGASFPLGQGFLAISPALFL